MKQLQANKYNVAWFKLAEFVARGEKERALGLYRLLTHSFDDQALAMQLEADLLHAFDDQVGAVDKYFEAAQLYQYTQQTVQAIAIYEQILLITPRIERYIVALIDLYTELNRQDRLIYWSQELVFALLSANPIIEQKVTHFLYKVLDLLIVHASGTMLADFLTQLDGHNHMYATVAHAYLESQS